MISNMGIVREPLEVDFVVDPRPLTLQERKMISDFIKLDKMKRKGSREKPIKKARQKKLHV
jgi:hypothetical protein